MLHRRESNASPSYFIIIIVIIHKVSRLFSSQLFCIHVNYTSIHAFFGGVGLITGIGSIIVKKGSKLHIQMGKLFSIGMVTSSLISIPISWMPNHENVFLFVIGVFTIYLVLAGNRALKFKNKTQADWVDKTISGTMLLFSVFMIENN